MMMDPSRIHWSRYAINMLMVISHSCCPNRASLALFLSRTILALSLSISLCILSSSSITLLSADQHSSSHQRSADPTSRFRPSQVPCLVLDTCSVLVCSGIAFGVFPSCGTLTCETVWNDAHQWCCLMWLRQKANLRFYNLTR